jgi:branched-chain amino acid transport system ATP-binding protein
MTTLALSDVGVAFGGNQVLESVSVDFGPGFNGLVGPNGAGKTTAFNVICGYVSPQKGAVILDGTPITARQPRTMSRQGVGRTFQAPRLVLEQTVLENVMLGRHNHVRSRHLAEILGLPSAARAEHEARARAEALLDRFGLLARAHEPAQSVPLGSQKLVEICRALASSPRVLLLDEPAAGLGVDDVAMMVQALRSVQAEENLCVVMIEHDLHLVKELCPFVAVLHFGKIIAQGTADDAIRNPQVVEAYLGKGVVKAS